MFRRYSPGAGFLDRGQNSISVHPRPGRLLESYDAHRLPAALLLCSALRYATALVGGKFVRACVK